MRAIKDIILSMRPKQWTKNIIIFAALIFSRHLHEVDYFFRALAGFGIFCLVSGSVYLFNDVIDIKNDLTHPVKRYRPVTSGRITVLTAVILSAVFSITGVILAYMMRMEFGFVTAGYVVLQLLYSFVLKHFVLLDVYAIAFGFVIRAAAGAYVIDVEISQWLLICTLLLSLFLGMSKRRHELTLAENGGNPRSVIAYYSPDMLDQMINIVGSGTVITYALYTVSPQTVEKFGTDKLIFTVPFVLFGIFRYLFLIHKKMDGGSPERVLLTDLPLIINIVLYGITAAGIIYLM